MPPGAGFSEHGSPSGISAPDMVFFSQNNQNNRRDQSMHIFQGYKRHNANRTLDRYHHFSQTTNFSRSPAMNHFFSECDSVRESSNVVFAEYRGNQFAFAEGKVLNKDPYGQWQYFSNYEDFGLLQQGRNLVGGLGNMARGTANMLGGAARVVGSSVPIVGGALAAGTGAIVDGVGAGVTAIPGGLNAIANGAGHVANFIGGEGANRTTDRNMNTAVDLGTRHAGVQVMAAGAGMAGRGATQYGQGMLQAGTGMIDTLANVNPVVTGVNAVNSAGNAIASGVHAYRTARHDGEVAREGQRLAGVLSPEQEALRLQNAAAMAPVAPVARPGLQIATSNLTAGMGAPAIARQPQGPLYAPQPVVATGAPQVNAAPPPYN
jgi:hypothetical protein